MRSDEWMEEFGDIADSQSPYVRALILDGSIEVCPVCGELSAYCWDDCDEWDGSAYNPPKGAIAHIGACSGFEWECGHCRNHIVERDSPINHPAYTHSDD